MPKVVLLEEQIQPFAITGKNEFRAGFSGVSPFADEMKIASLDECQRFCENVVALRNINASTAISEHVENGS